MLAKAETLVEALPYLQRYAGKTFVVKYGGHAMGDPELARDFAEAHLRKGGDFLIKLFQGEGFDAYVKDLRPRYQKLTIRKPAASRRRSNEVYALAAGKR